MKIYILLKSFFVFLIAASVAFAQYDGGPGGGYASAEGPPTLGQTMPVELTSFNVNVIKGNAYLTWSTSTEVNNYGYQIERERYDEWNSIGFVQGAGNSNSPKNYEFIDAEKLTGMVKYRLKQIDNDGGYSYSSVIEVNIGVPITNSLEQNFPNPFNPTTNIRFSITEGSFVRLAVYNIVGELVKILVNEQKEAGIYTVGFDARGLNSGIYFYKIEAHGFVETNKMILLK